MQLLVLGTDTGVGKTRVTCLLTRGLRALGRRVWLHKPVACPIVDGRAEDAHALEALCGDGQDVASVVPIQLRAAAAPVVAAAAEHVSLNRHDYLQAVQALVQAAPEDLLLEGVGGVLVPLSADGLLVSDLLPQAPVLLVTRPHLGTLNHSALSVEALQRRGRRVLGLVLNRHEAVSEHDIAIATVREQLQAMTGLLVLADLPYGADRTHAPELAEAVLRATQAEAA